VVTSPAARYAGFSMSPAPTFEQGLAKMDPGPVLDFLDQIGRYADSGLNGSPPVSPT